ncbi:MAG: hypothetical protein KF830_07850 [Planctomycetes bacterium]|nr:hypothetical protein [Planctomycetota bacterium]
MPSARRKAERPPVQDAACPRGVSTFGYDSYGRLLQIADDVWTIGSAFAVASQFDYECAAASNLLKENYAKVDGSAGDRFGDAQRLPRRSWRRNVP